MRGGSDGSNREEYQRRSQRVLAKFGEAATKVTSVRLLQAAGSR